MEMAEKLYSRVSEKDLVLSTAMVYGYAKNGKVEVARSIFNGMPEKDVTPLEYLAQALKEDFQKIWDAVRKLEVCKEAALSEFFNVEVTALSSYKEKEELFKEQVGQLRQRFIHSIAPGGLAADRRGVIPASGFCLSALQIWKVIRENKDLNLPAHKVMVATVRCEQIADEKLKGFMSDKGWLELETAVNSGLVPGFGKKYDTEAMYFDEDVRTAKRQQLESEILKSSMAEFDAGLRASLSEFELDQTTIQKMVMELRESARGIVEEKAREEAGNVFHCVEP
ncbi:hypothetical protein E2562_005005 [Oryza meyeriana var. granulata]|uniref:Sey1/RHD3-like three-helix bundle domain-containing protein n=1 Tax=Oryza meyeriana var. granulata TaxID=110450 RepID=A0A6G1C3I0_9ORYZ|nr:hypothetical protein E2562_005005 [Oryza meyeriana var. granulata]